MPTITITPNETSLQTDNGTHYLSNQDPSAQVVDFPTDASSQVPGSVTAINSATVYLQAGVPGIGNDTYTLTAEVVTSTGTSLANVWPTPIDLTASMTNYNDTDSSPSQTVADWQDAEIRLTFDSSKQAGPDKAEIEVDFVYVELDVVTTVELAGTADAASLATAATTTVLRSLSATADAASSASALSIFPIPSYLSVTSDLFDVMHLDPSDGLTDLANGNDLTNHSATYGTGSEGDYPGDEVGAWTIYGFNAQYLDAPWSSLSSDVGSLTTAFSAAWWIKNLAVGAGGEYPHWSFGPSGVGVRAVQPSGSDDTALAVAVDNDAGTTVHTAPEGTLPSYADNEWRLVVMTWDGESVGLIVHGPSGTEYDDSTSAGSSGNSIIWSGDDFVLSAEDDGGTIQNYRTEEMNFVGISSSVLDANDATTIYAARNIADLGGGTTQFGASLPAAAMAAAAAAIDRPLTVTADTAAAIQSALATTRPLASTLDAASAATASGLSYLRYLSTTLDAATTAAAALDAARRFAGTSDAAADATAAVRLTARFAGQSPQASALQAALSRAAALSGSAPAAAESSAALARAAALVGTLDAAADASAALSLSALLQLAATLDAASGGTAGLRATRPLTATAGSAADARATLARTAALSGSAPAAADATAALSTAGFLILAGVLNAASSAAATAAVARPLTATAGSAADARATLARTAALSGSAPAAADALAILTTAGFLQLAATLAAASDAQAALARTERFTVPSIPAVTESSAALSRGVGLTTALPASTESTAGLSRTLGLAAGIPASADALAAMARTAILSGDAASAAAALAALDVLAPFSGTLDFTVGRLLLGRTVDDPGLRWATAALLGREVDPLTGRWSSRPLLWKWIAQSPRS